MIPVAFDLRDPDRSGIARVARSLARSFTEQFSSEFRVTFAGPVSILESLGVRRWGGERSPIELVDWSGGRYSPVAELQWERVRRDVGDAIWYFPHWDVPWHAHPERYVTTIHDMGHLRLPGVSWPRRELARRWMRHTTAGAQVVTVVTRFTGDQLSETWPELSRKIQLLPNGVDAHFFQEAPSLPDEISSRIQGRPFMLSVGIRKLHKNLALGPEVLSRVPGLHWVVVGEWFPAWKAVEERAARVGVSDRMIVYERQDDRALTSLYHHAACLFFPSRYEGFGLPILESLAAGTPVVIANAAGSVETLGGCGWICDPDSPGELARAVNETLTLGDARSAYAVRARARAREFSWKNSAARLAEIIRVIA